MNPDAPPLARYTFLQATQAGPSRAPAAVAAVLANPETQADTDQLDVSVLAKALDAEFPWRNQLVFQARRPQTDEVEAWIQVIRWLINSLDASGTKAEGSTRRIQVLLTAITCLDVGHEGLSAISDRFVGSYVQATLVSLLRSFQQVPNRSDARSTKWLRELAIEVKAGNFKMLRDAQYAIQPIYQVDIWTYVFLLWKLEPTELARLVNSRDSIFFSLLVCAALDAHAPQFALQVESVTFKFISLSWLEQMKRIHTEIDTIGVLERLLLQVAKTPLWKGWLQATYHHPTEGSEHSKALAAALAQLAEPQWKDFIFALALSKLRGSAEAVADILTRFAHELGSAKAQPIWSSAFERWNDWDYGRHEGTFHLGSPQVCAFDFPVAMYYSHMPAGEREVVEQTLQDEIFHIEQRWFSNESELCTERNRLASRLRLVRHGGTLAAGGTEALPAPVQPDSEYAEVRYRYHDVNAARDRTMRP